MKRMHFLKTASVFLLGLFFSIAAVAQQNPASRPSPAAKASGKIGDANITINYSSPAVKGRQIFGGLEPYGKVWRAGANEATTFETDKDIMVEGKKLPAGKYGFFVIPTENDWTVIFNKTANQWGAFNYDQNQDVLRVTAKPKKAASLHERLAYNVNKNGIVLQWENVELPVAIK